MTESIPSPNALFATFRETLTLDADDGGMFDAEALTLAFAADEQKQKQWHVFVEGVALDPGDLAGVIEDFAAFLVRHVTSAAELGRRRDVDLEA